MTSYELFLLCGSLTGSLAICALASVFLDQGSVRIMAALAVISGAGLYMADVHAPDGLNFYDLPAAIGKMIALFS